MKENKNKFIVGDYNEFKEDLKLALSGMKRVLSKKQMLIPNSWNVLQGYIDRSMDENKTGLQNTLDNPIQNDTDIMRGSQIEEINLTKDYHADKVERALKAVKGQRKTKEKRERALRIYANVRNLDLQLNKYALFQTYIPGDLDISYSSFDEWTSKFDEELKKLTSI